MNKKRELLPIAHCLVIGDFFINRRFAFFQNSSKQTSMNVAPIATAFAMTSFGQTPQSVERESNESRPPGVFLLSRSHSTFSLTSSTSIQGRGISLMGMSVVASEVAPLSGEIAATGSYGFIYFLGFAQLVLVPAMPCLRWYSAPEQKPKITEEPKGALRPRQIVRRFFDEMFGSPTPLERAKKRGKEQPFRDCVQRCVAEIREKCKVDAHTFDKASAIDDCSNICGDIFLREISSDPYRDLNEELDRIISGKRYESYRGCGDYVLPSSP